MGHVYFQVEWHPYVLLMGCTNK